jgi:hypothetical protein
VSEWLLFNANSAITAISWRKQVNFQWYDDEVRFVLDKHAELDLHSASSLKQQSADRHVAPLGHIILISSQPVCSYSLMLRSYRRSNKYKFYSLWKILRNSNIKCRGRRNFLVEYTNKVNNISKNGSTKLFWRLAGFYMVISKHANFREIPFEELIYVIKDNNSFKIGVTLRESSCCNK